MTDNISQLLATLQKPSRKFRSLTVRLTDTEYMQLESHSRSRFSNVSDVVRLAITAHLNPTNS